MPKRKDVQPIYTQTFQQRRWFISVILIILALLTFLGMLIFNHYRYQNALKKYPIRGVSLSQTDGYVDFAALKKAKVNFVYLKASQGATYTDDSFNSNFSRSQGAQLPIGIYHVFSFSSTATAQFDNLVDQVDSNTGVLPIAIQVELYGDYKDESINWKQEQTRLTSLKNKIWRYYKRPVIIWGDQQTLHHLNVKVGRTQQTWISDAPINTPNGDATFLQLKGQPEVNMAGTKQEFYQSVFNGNQQKWENYINQLVN